MNIIPINTNVKDGSSELKDLAISNVVEGFLADEKTREKLFKLLGVIAVPAFEGIIKNLGNDKVRYMVYHDEQYGVVIQKFNTATTEMTMEQPTKDDVYIIKKSDVANIENLLKTLLSSIGSKLF